MIYKKLMINKIFEMILLTSKPSATTLNPLRVTIINSKNQNTLKYQYILAFLYYANRSKLYLV